MKLLVIDTATPRIVTGIVDMADDRAIELAGRSQFGATAHAEVLAPSIAEVCAESGIALSELDGIVVGLGPGPFTGLRVGIVTAAALGDALGVPVWGVCSLDALAGDYDALVVTDARRKELYFARYVGDRRIDGPSVLTPDALAAHVGTVDVVVHAGADKYLPELRQIGVVEERYPTPVSLVDAASRAGLIGAASSELQPIYIRRPDAAEPRPRPKLDVTGPTPA